MSFHQNISGFIMALFVGKSMNSNQFQLGIDYFKGLQDSICRALSAEDGDRAFREDQWNHDNGGGGRTRVLTGHVFEQAGVNFSHVKGENLPTAATEKRPQMAGQGFEASGVSLVVHPDNPFIPTSHANVRLFRTLPKKPEDKSFWWFGGGFDLTPFYPFDADIKHWNQVAYETCRPIGSDVYPRFKAWCDDYF